MSKSKWDCKHCTYSNYPQSIHCTMCRNPRQTISECTASTSNNAEPSKWPCGCCTFLNVGRAKRCSLCQTVRPSEFDHLDFESSPIKDESTIDLEEAEAVDKALNKWSCSECTFKNWPGLTACGICSTPRDDSTSSQEDEILVGNDITEDVETSYPEPSSPNNREPFDYHLHVLQKAVDTGCVSFLKALRQLLNTESYNVECVLHYLYAYYDASFRKITASEDYILSRLADCDNILLYNRSFAEMLRFRDDSYLSNIPEEFMDKGSEKILPGAVVGDGSDDLHEYIRHSTSKDFSMARLSNSSVFFIMPNLIYDMRAILTSEEKVHSVLMDLTDTQIMYTINCSDTTGQSCPLGQECYAPLVLRNRGGGHSLVDAISQTLWGIVDRDDVLRSAVYNTLFIHENIFRERWINMLEERNMNLNDLESERFWSNILDCHEPGSPMEQIHILVLAQILNRPIVVLPIESSKTKAISSREIKGKHPMEGYYPQLPMINNFRICPPLFIGYFSGAFFALVLPPPQRSPISNKIKAAKPIRVYRYIRCPSFSLENYAQFATDENEAKEFVQFGLLVDTDKEGAPWIFHSSFLYPYIDDHDSGTDFWCHWIRNHLSNFIEK